MMNRLDALWDRARPLLACYLPVGDPLTTETLIETYLTCGVDIVELGLPTREPWMDGPDVSSAMRRALDSGTDLIRCMTELGSDLKRRAPSIALICMTYAEAEVLEGASQQAFAQLDGLLALGESTSPAVTDLLRNLRTQGLRGIAFVKAHLDAVDIRRARICDGYVMLQTTEGVTGPRSALDSANQFKTQKLRAAGVSSPILFGFGISTPEQCKLAIELGANGVVIGSECLRMALRGARPLQDFLLSVRASLDG